VQTLKSTDAMAKAMAGATKSMAAMNKRMNLPALHQIMKEFEKQNAKMDMVDEMMGDAMDDVFEVRLSTKNPYRLSRLCSRHLHTIFMKKSLILVRAAPFQPFHLYAKQESRILQQISSRSALLESL
jgi:hypothetical protein